IKQGKLRGMSQRKMVARRADAHPITRLQPLVDRLRSTARRILPQDGNTIVPAVSYPVDQRILTHQARLDLYVDMRSGGEDRQRAAVAVAQLEKRDPCRQSDLGYDLGL